jgi:hypothetical protein
MATSGADGVGDVTSDEFFPQLASRTPSPRTRRASAATAVNLRGDLMGNSSVGGGEQGTDGPAEKNYALGRPVDARAFPARS